MISTIWDWVPTYGNLLMTKASILSISYRLSMLSRGTMGMSQHTHQGASKNRGRKLPLFLAEMANMPSTMLESKKWQMTRNGHKPRSLKCSMTASSLTRSGKFGSANQSQTNRTSSASTTRLKRSTASAREPNRKKT